MRATEFYAPTLRQVPSEAEVPSHQLLLRGGFIRQLSAGVFTFLPLGLRVLRKVERVIREEMDRAGAHEVLMPVIHPQELWERSGRWTSFVPAPLKTKDRTGRWFLLAPTHEEAVTDAVMQDVSSYRDLPVCLYQIQQKFRDEARPRAGLIRGKEFIMKDAYSFDADMAGLDASFEKQFEAYTRLFARMHLDVLVVEAEAGAIGGFGTREFMLPTPNGEDTIIQCGSCGYASNLECAVSKPSSPSPGPGAHDAPPADSPVLVQTPGAKTIEAVTEMLDRPACALIKTLLYRADDQAAGVAPGATGPAAGRFVAALVRGDRQLNEIKLAKLVQDESLRMAEPEEIRELTGGDVGYSGPVGLAGKAEIIADHEIELMGEAVVGANQTDAHLTGVRVGEHFTPDRYADLREAAADDACAHCDGGKLAAVRGIELGHVFKLGTKYSEALGAVFQDEHGEQHPMIMGCYGIGVSRIVSALVEQWHDDSGIMWPRSVAPFEVAVLLLDPKNDEIVTMAEGVYEGLQAEGLEVLLDDRDERPGVKFKDAELIGYPVVIVVGKKAAQEGVVEVRRRKDKAEQIVPLAEAVATAKALAEEA
ncbi:MAG: proline--tRNA ligase [Armatimonadetes bacterium]|nr:proline--tRNA ligase [Armatimonadota bacterium]